MEKVPAELMKEYVNSQKFTSTTEIMEAMKAMFGDVLQQVMEAELDTKLGYEKSQRTENEDESGLSERTFKKDGKNAARRSDNKCSSGPKRRI